MRTDWTSSSSPLTGYSPTPSPSVQFREKLARVFGRVIVACDRLPHVTLPSVAHGSVDDQAAVVSVSAFLIEHSEQWLQGDKLVEVILGCSLTTSRRAGRAHGGVQPIQRAARRANGHRL